MASPPPMAQPLAARSPDKANVNLRHPIPDLQSLQGAYVGNIERLEEHAERMSESGSDLGEEIRKLHTELKRSDSRDEGTRHTSNRSRNVSISSHANSIVDVNGAARWGGYSPGGYVTSPVSSLRSNSWSNPSVPVNRQRSESKASRLGQVVHPNEIDERANLAMSPGSPESLRSAPLAIHTSDSPPPQPARKVSSFTQNYEDIANELRDELRNSVILDPLVHHGDEQHSEEYRRYATRDDYPDRPPTAASTDTSRQARLEWQDFDGVHCPDTVPEEDEDHSRHSSFSNSMLKLDDYTTAGAPPPDDGMVFYPAPVPRLLNLPKRLSQLPASNVQARRRTQLLDSMQAENRKSAPMLGEMTADAPSPPRNNRKSMLNLPPQLRASAYFDNQAAPSQEFAVQGESAQDTLESILNASARAPVSAFTDHPFSGHVGPEVYRPEHKRKSTARLPEVPPTLAETRRRSSFNMLNTKRNSSGDPLNKLRKRNSSADMNLLIVKASEQRMSLGDQLDHVYEDDRGPENHDGQDPARHSIHHVEGRNPDDVYDEEHQNDEEPEPEEAEEEPQYFGAPTTLLAELQMRKAKQKTRNMNYATLVEQGNMPTHRTLLELDDIAEKEKQKRLKKKVNLAWEAQGEDDDSDDDVPLAVLYKQPQQQREMDRPLGLIARRELEDKEPLSYRRARLRGESPNRRGLRQTPSQMHLAAPTTTTPGPETDEEEGETLGDRMRRLREKKELDEALGNDIRKSTISLDFASEMMSKFGVSDEPKDASQPAPSPGVEEEETLGQRRARLQAEAAARGDAPADTTRPGLRPHMSMADILSANPIDVHNQTRKVSDQQLISHLPPGSLLQQNVVAEERRKAERMNQNMRASSFGSYNPLVGAAAKKNDDDQPLALKIQAYKNRIAGIPDHHAQSMMFNNGLATPNPAMNMNMNMNMGMNDGTQSMMMGMNGMGMMSQPNLGMMPMMGMSQQNLGMMGMQPQMGMQGMQGMQPQMGAMHTPSMMGMPMSGMPMNMNVMGMMMQPPMDPRQRDQIDRWMQNVQH